MNKTMTYFGGIYYIKDDYLVIINFENYCNSIFIPSKINYNGVIYPVKLFSNGFVQYCCGIRKIKLDDEFKEKYDKTFIYSDDYIFYRDMFIWISPEIEHFNIPNKIKKCFFTSYLMKFIKENNKLKTIKYRNKLIYNKNGEFSLTWN